MPRLLRKINRKSRAALLTELDRLRRQERTPSASIENCSVPDGGEASFPACNSGSERLASLAALTLSRQTPGLVLPLLSQIPTSYTLTAGGDLAIGLGRSLVQLGLGSPQLWRRHNGNLTLFIRDALKEWLESLGASMLEDHVDIDFAIVDHLDELQCDEGKLFILLETSDGCGFLAIGKVVKLLEDEQPGLGRAFYLILIQTANMWMDTYDITATEYFLERWKESIEMDMENGDGSEEAFQAFCKEHDITFPDLKAATPACLRDVDYHGEYRHRRRFIDLLSKHRNGKHTALIEPILAMAAIRKTTRGLSRDVIEGVWDEGPLPNWVIAFEAHDPITQAFDEESRSMNECTHAPTWIDCFDCTNSDEVKRVLDHVRKVVEINRRLVDLGKALESIERSLNLAATHQS